MEDFGSLVPDRAHSILSAVLFGTGSVWTSEKGPVHGDQGKGGSRSPKSFAIREREKAYIALRIR